MIIDFIFRSSFFSKWFIIGLNITVVSTFNSFTSSRISFSIPSSISDMGGLGGGEQFIIEAFRPSKVMEMFPYTGCASNSVLELSRHWIPLSHQRKEIFRHKGNESELKGLLHPSRKENSRVELGCHASSQWIFLLHTTRLGRVWPDVVCSFLTLCKIVEIKIGGKTRFENLLALVDYLSLHFQRGLME